MQYITIKRFKEIAVCGKKLNIPYGTKLNIISDFIATTDGKAICYPTSENAHRYFARNDDNNGLERGKITYALAYGKRKPTNIKDRQFYRFSDKEIKILKRDWKHFLRKDVDVILFNHEFFNADIEELRKMAKQFNIRVR